MLKLAASGLHKASNKTSVGVGIKDTHTQRHTHSHTFWRTKQSARCEQPVPFAAGLLLCYKGTGALFPPHSPSAHTR